MNRPHPAPLTCWIAVNHRNQMVPATARTDEANAQAEAEDYAGRPWRFLAEQGWHTIAVTLTAGDAYATAMLRADHQATHPHHRRRLGT